jgi:purine-binding chemotaxis protein CheW
MIDSTKTDGPAAKLVAFHIDRQEFCIDLMSVREIRSWTHATPLPQAPPFLRGVIDLRGSVLPIVDLAARLGFAPAEPSARHAIMVVQCGSQVVGLLVEGVSDIFTVGEKEVQPTPDVASEATKQLVQGMIVMDGRMISRVVLDSIVPADLANAA